MPRFAVRALELHSAYVWDMAWARRALDFSRAHDMTTLVLHRNDIVDLVVYPGRMFGASDDCANIFERYQQIYRKLYKYTPTRRSGPYQRRDYLRRVCDLAARQGTEVWLQNKELSFHDIFLEFNPQLTKGGTVCPNEKFWWDFLNAKYTELFQDLPGVAGVVTAPGTGESRLSAAANRCDCELCRTTTRGQWYGKLIGAMHAPIRAAGKQLAVRDFVFDRAAHEELAEAIELLPTDIIISLKNTPHDYYPTFPDNPRLGRVGQHRQWIEYDCMGQYYGWGIAPAIMLDDIARRLSVAEAAGAEGVVFRTDWESLDGHSVFHTPNLVNLHAGAALSHDAGASRDGIWRSWLEEQDMLEPGADPAPAIAWLEAVLGGSWEITRRACYAQDCVFSDSTNYPVSLDHAFWLAEEKNSLRDWDAAKADALAPTEAVARRVMAEKNEAVARAQALRPFAAQRPAGLTVAAHRDIEARVNVFVRYVRGFRSIGHALILARVLLQGSPGAFRDEAEMRLGAALADLLETADDFEAFARATDQHHRVYTLLSPDRLRALHADLTRRLAARPAS
jgi:hypothetical protein